MAEIDSDPMPHLPQPTIVRVEIVAGDDGTTLTVTDGPLPDVGAAGAEAGYASALDKLAVALTDPRASHSTRVS